MKIQSFIKQSMNSSFPNLSETYKCKFVEYREILDGKFTLLVLNTTNSADKNCEYSTIVQKSIDIPDELKNEIFELETEYREGKDYPKIKVID